MLIAIGVFLVGLILFSSPALAFWVAVVCFFDRD